MAAMQIQITVFVMLNPNPVGHIKGVTVWLGVLYDSQVTNRRQGGFSARALCPLAHSYWAPRSHRSRPEYTKTPSNSGYILLLFD
jgi:hypothetical protein